MTYIMGDSIDKKRKKTLEILRDVSDMSSKFSEVGRNIVFAIIAGCWVVHDKFPSSLEIFVQLSIVFAFLYLVIDLTYYGSTMIIYNNFLLFNDNTISVEVKDESEIFKVQYKVRKRFLILTKIKMLLLIMSIASLLLFVFYNDLADFVIKIGALF